MTLLDYSEPTPTDVRRSARRAIVSIAVLAPIIIATIASLYGSIWSMSQRLLMHWPQNPWESAIVADAWRFARGLPVYERLPEGHATHLYGALTSPTIGVFFKLFGTSNLYVGRLIVLACALATCVILLRIFAPRKWLVWFIGAGLMLALHYRGRAYFVETRPDMIGALLATLAMIAFYRAHALRAFWLYLPGIAIVTIAMLYKQTYACVAAAPLLATLMNWRESKRQDIAITFTPLIALVASVIAMKFFTPNVYYYMFTVPSMYKIDWQGRAPFAIASLFMLSPLFVALLGWFVMNDERRASIDPKMRWLIAAMIVGCGAGMLAFAKRGGSYNSLLLGFIPMTAFCVAMIDPVIRRLTDPAGNAITQIVGGWAIGLFIAISTFAVPNSDLWNFAGSHGDVEYANIVKTVRGLNGTIVCPDDPTLLIASKGAVCRSLEAELDATDRPGKLPPGLYEEVAAADYLIRVHAHYDGWYTPEMMTSLGFERLSPKESGPGFRKIYSLWKRVAPAPEEAVDPNRPKRRRGMPAH